MTVDAVPTNRAPELGVWRLAWRVAHQRPIDFWVGSLLFVVYFSMPAATGYALGRGYDAMASAATSSVYRWALVVAASEIVRMTAVHFGALIWTRVWMHMQTLLRANLLAAQMASGGPEAGQPVGSAGGAVTYFRDDTEDIAQFVDIHVDVAGGLVFTAIAGFVLGNADVRAAAILVFPLLAVGVATRLLDTRIKEYRSADRAATAAVTGFVGDLMASATTVKVNGAAPSAIVRLRRLVDERRRTAVRDRILDEGVQAFSQGAADVGLGCVLLVSAGGLATGAFDVGELALFAAYLGWLSFLPRMIGRLLARRKHAAVAFERIRQLVADADVEHTVRRRDLPIAPRDARVRPVVERPQRVPLERLEVVGFSAVHDSGYGVHDASFVVERGDFVVITGPIGSGKSTLLRSLLGLAWHAETSGIVRWNGREVDDLAAFMVPPNAAYLSQVPQLISDSVADNVGLGVLDAHALSAALNRAAVADDIATMPDGVDTVIGPRGLRLSGGQRQRLATARAIVHEPELVVLDDLSSAVDVETELALWRNLAEARMTVIAVSHRAVAFERATRVLRLERGRLV
jgi:ATP-binding cassette, subfamily B, bacterial